MRKIFALLTLLFAFNIQAQTSTFNALLQKNVDIKGNVNYKGLKSEEAKLDNYLGYLKATTPSTSWSKNKQKAFWMNAYNAYTIKLILDNYPLKSIRSIKQKGKGAWDIPFAVVGGKSYSLNHIEHKILRAKLFDPRIHVGVNCASGSCPKLHNKAFTESNVNSELEKLMKIFVNDPTRNKTTDSKKVALSEIFNWYKGDFTKKGSLIDYLNKYSNTKLEPKARISYLTYNWNLNGK